MKEIILSQEKHWNPKVNTIESYDDTLTEWMKCVLKMEIEEENFQKIIQAPLWKVQNSVLAILNPENN